MDPSTAHLVPGDELRAHLHSLDEQATITFLADVDRAHHNDLARPINLAASALYYAEHIGWPVFPLVPRGKKPLTPNGFKDATCDPGTVRGWWQRWPEANIGTPTGRRVQGGCGYDVIDVDGPDGYASIATLQHADCPDDCCSITVCRARGRLPELVAKALTPGDATRERPRPPGSHLFSLAAGTSCTTRALPGIDLRGDGGYVVIPPSVGHDGGRYEWTHRPPVGGGA